MGTSLLPPFDLVVRGGLWFDGTAGLLGLSTMTTKLDKIGGERFRSRPLPSTHATWKEYRRLNRVLRRRRRVLQSAPDARMPLNAVLFLAESRGWYGEGLRTGQFLRAGATQRRAPQQTGAR